MKIPRQPNRPNQSRMIYRANRDLRVAGGQRNEPMATLTRTNRWSPWLCSGGESRWTESFGDVSHTTYVKINIIRYPFFCEAHCSTIEYICWFPNAQIANTGTGKRITSTGTSSGTGCPILENSLVLAHLTWLQCSRSVFCAIYHSSPNLLSSAIHSVAIRDSIFHSLSIVRAACTKYYCHYQ